MTRTLTLNHKTYTFDQLRRGAETVPPDSLTPYETTVLEFCRAWLAGQEVFVIHSSGSTGLPKPIRLTRCQMQASARLTGQALGLQAGDRALACLPVQYIAGMMMLVRGFELGLHLTVVEPGSNPLAGFPAETHFDFTALVPLQLQQILTGLPAKLPLLNGMKAILIGGGPVSVALHEQLQTVTAPIYHTYGMTETVTHIALRRLNGSQASEAFSPLPGVEIDRDERGCLIVRAEVTNGETLQTNDLIDLRPDGSFIWLGRLDHVINSGGVKVQIDQVETALAQVFYHYRAGRFSRRRFFVGPVEDERLGQAVVAVVEGDPFSAEIENEIRAALRERLGPYEVPRRFYFVERLLETPTGKIDRLANLGQV